MNTDVMAKTRLLLAQLFLKTESTYTFGINDHRALVIESTLFTIFWARVLIPLHLHAFNFNFSVLNLNSEGESKNSPISG